MTQQSTLYEPRLDAPAWASAFGQDEYGYFADFSIETGDRYWQRVSLRMRWIPPATLWMGSPEDEHKRQSNELRHKVTLTEGFWMAETACTQELWLAVMGKNPSEFDEDDALPVENVSWDDAREFCQSVMERLPKLKLSLPTEAQWELACRCMSETPFQFGNDIDSSIVNYDGNYPYFADSAKGLNRGKTVPAKHFEPNRWGLYQMHGNVLEWCTDWYGAYSTESVVDPAGPSNGNYRVLRGGSWINSARNVRSAVRRYNVPGYRSDVVGFRILNSASAASSQAESASAS